MWEHDQLMKFIGGSNMTQYFKVNCGKVAVQENLIKRFLESYFKKLFKAEVNIEVKDVTEEVLKEGWKP